MLLGTYDHSEYGCKETMMDGFSIYIVMNGIGPGAFDMSVAIRQRTQPQDSAERVAQPPPGRDATPPLERRPPGKSPRGLWELD